MTRILALLATLFVTLPALAQDIPAPLTPHVSDFADALDPETEARITEKLISARTDPGTEIAVVTMTALDAFGPVPDIETLATGVFNTWGIGDRTRNNGILILVIPNAREMRLELGSGYGTAWNVTAENVVDGVFLPAFRNGDIPGGIEAGTEAVISRIAAPFSLNRPPEEPGLWDRVRDGPLLPILVFAGIALLALRRRIGDAATRIRKCPTCGRRMLRRSRETLRDPSRDTPGEGRETVHCTSCDYHDTRTYPIRHRSSSGRGGFGGGSSSGGGASGRW